MLRGKLRRVEGFSTTAFLDERMRNWQVGHGLHFGYLENSEVGRPLMKPEQRVMIAADVFWRTGPTDRTVEHPAK